MFGEFGKGIRKLWHTQCRWLNWIALGTYIRYILLLLDSPIEDLYIQLKLIEFGLNRKVMNSLYGYGLILILSAVEGLLAGSSFIGKSSDDWYLIFIVYK